MQTVVGVRFKKAGKIYYFSPGELKMAAGDNCVVETARGIEFGEVVVPPKRIGDDEVVQPLKQVVRLATFEDEKLTQEHEVRAKDAFEIALAMVTEHGLPMKLIEAEYTFDDSKLIFYFTADGRVDFRELVKNLAAVFRTRIELRQIGVRDEAKMLGGLGSCGRSLCCSTFLGDFAPVSIKMAKEQNLSLNPSKISGICGRLMCCLRYESDVYSERKSVFGEGCSGGCSGKNHLPTEEYPEELEEDENYYSDLLLEDTINPVDYAMMRETAEVEEQTGSREQDMANGQEKSQSKPKAKKTGKKGGKNKQRHAKPDTKKQDASGKDEKPTEQRPRRPRRKKRASQNKPSANNG